MKKLVAFCLSIMVIGLLSGCSNTAEGAGRDIEGWGQWMQETF